MLTTVEADGCLRSRPMATQDTAFDGTLWFFTRVDTAKVHEIERDRHVNLSFANPSDEVYVSVSGTARVVRDQAKAKELWNPLYKAWFPQGVDDPELSLLRVEVEKAEYWDSPSSAVVQLIGFAKAIATGKTYAEEGTDHEKITI
jgi:general stress protein 26